MLFDSLYDDETTLPHRGDDDSTDTERRRFAALVATDLADVAGEVE